MGFQYVDHSIPKRSVAGPASEVPAFADIEKLRVTMKVVDGDRADHVFQHLRAHADSYP